MLTEHSLINAPNSGSQRHDRSLLQQLFLLATLFLAIMGLISRQSEAQASAVVSGSTVIDASNLSQDQTEPSTTYSPVNLMSWEQVRTTISGGGCTSIGDPYQIDGTIGQVCSQISAGLEFDLSSGFWPGIDLGHSFIFADGFESGDRTRWNNTTKN